MVNVDVGSFAQGGTPVSGLSKVLSGRISIEWLRASTISISYPPAPGAVRFLTEWSDARTSEPNLIRKSHMRRIALFMAVFALAACNDATSPNGSPIGTYSLRTVNGFGLPYTFSHGPVLISDQLELNSAGSYIEAVLRR